MLQKPYIYSASAFVEFSFYSLYMFCNEKYLELYGLEYGSVEYKNSTTQTWMQVRHQSGILQCRQELVQEFLIIL